ncbi:MAG: hypothetical protein H0U61_14990 [Nocardioidaceae bacterium]|nr:hypothetical protein [Nocardioidaceae bacterium]
MSKYRLVSAGRAVVLTHLEGFSMPPTSSHKVTRSTKKQTVVRAGVKISGGASAEVGNKIISKAEVHMNMELKASGAHTSTTSLRITDRIANKTRHNATFAFYSGVTRAAGRWKLSYCGSKYDSHGNYLGTYVFWRYGRWSSYQFSDSGAVRCGAGTKYISAAAKQALRRVCG